MNISKSALTIGIVGAGGFAGFAAKAFLQVEGIKIVAITDIHFTSATQLADELDAKAYRDYETLLKDSSINLVYIATPPYLHYSQSKMALLAGKHVICEKPAALKTIEAEELVSIARAGQLLYVINLMQRYNPLFALVRNLVKEKVLGDFLHGFFENYASDENLNPDHWFWDEEKSGGIFIEHGVHFFDLFSGWLGAGEMIHAAQWQRPDVEKKIVDRVEATINYPKGPVTFYHGFDQPKILDRQEMRLLFEKGDITLYEWVPVKIRLHGLFKKEQLQELERTLGVHAIVRHNQPGANQKVRGRFHDLIFDDHVTLESGSISDKQGRYQQLLIDMIKDQWNWILDRTHVRVINENNAVESLRMAEEATRISKSYAAHSS